MHRILQSETIHYSEKVKRMLVNDNGTMVFKFISSIKSYEIDCECLEEAQHLYSLCDLKYVSNTINDLELYLNLNDVQKKISYYHYTTIKYALLIKTDKNECIAVSRTNDKVYISKDGDYHYLLEIIKMIGKIKIESYQFVFFDELTNKL